MLEDKNNKNKGKVNYNKLNDVLHISHQMLKIFHILTIIVCIYVGIKVFQEVKIFDFLIDVLAILSPLFIGLIIAWLFNPIITFLGKKGVKRVFGIAIVYIVFIGLLSLLIGSILPILYDQIISFAGSIPGLLGNIENTLNNFLEKFNSIDGLNIDSIKYNIVEQVEKFTESYSSGLANNIVNIIKAFISGLSTFVIGLIIGFFLLLGFENVGSSLIGFVPKRYRKDASKLTNTINYSLRRYILGVIIDAFVIFTICSIVFSLIGLRAPLLFALFCAITNVIPYVGPYIGAVPALIVAFSINPTVGILTLIAIVVIQFFEGNFLQGFIMSKTTKLHPVTIITGLLIFGHYLGIIGMVISTPLIAVCKQIWNFFDDKYDFFKGREVEVDE